MTIKQNKQFQYIPSNTIHGFNDKASETIQNPLHKSILWHHGCQIKTQFLTAQKI